MRPRLLADVAIIGAGVAGTAAATSLRKRGLSVILFEKLELERWPLGESLPAHTKPLLAQLGLNQHMTAPVCMSCDGVDSCWGTDEIYRRSSLQNAFGSGWLLDRARFNALMRRTAVEAGTLVLTDAGLRSVVQQGDTWHLETERESDPIRASFLLDASGRQRWLAKRMGARIAVDGRGQFAVAVELGVPLGAPELPAGLLIETSENGWWYFAPIPGRRAMAMFMTDAQVLRSSGHSPEALWQCELARTKHVRERAANLVRIRARVARCDSSRVVPSTESGWAAVGDASMTFDPLASAGLQMALADGIDVAEALSAEVCRASLHLRDYGNARANDYQRYLRELSDYYALERRWSNSGYWVRRTTAARHARERHQVPWRKIT